jgi:predicted enzyme related to lactoylglutathione lyase
VALGRWDPCPGRRYLLAIAAIDENTGIGWAAVTIDAVDPAAVARFWSGLLGSAARPVGDDRPGWWRVGPWTPGGPGLTVQPVPEAGGGKNRVHLDLWVDDLDRAVARAEVLGARRLGSPQHLVRGTIAVMADVEGNEFCLLSSPSAGTTPARGTPSAPH